ncbi:MAG: hypothetical protein M5U26_03510 [Planctomycetota bacterium]|nr:hypothetical protein [Planctomycetota bacterium]
MDDELREVLKELARLLKAGQNAGAAYAGPASLSANVKLKGQQTGKAYELPYDEARTGIPTAPRALGRFILAQGELSNSAADLFTADQDYHDCLLVLCNKDSSDRTVTALLKLQGGTARNVAYTEPVPTGAPAWVSFEFALRKGDVVRGNASANSVVDWNLLGRKAK